MNISLRSYALLAVLLASLSGCSSHCTCPPQPTPTTTVVEPSHND